MNRISAKIRSLKVKSKYNNKIKKILISNKEIGNKKLTKDQINIVKGYWRNLGVDISTRWHQAYTAINGNFDPAYIPEDVFYSLVIPRLGLLNLSKAYADKNIYDKLFADIKKPKTIIRNIHGVYYDSNYLKLNYNSAQEILLKQKGTLIIKPSIESSQGRGVYKVEIESDTMLCNKEHVSLKKLENNYGGNFLFQEEIKQHPLLEGLYPHSLNTIRITTLNFNDKIDILSSVLKVGNNGREVDNGGIYIGISSRGELNQFATDKHFNRYTIHPYTSAGFNNITLPNFHMAQELVKKMHEKLLYFNLASWDIALDRDGNYLFIEVNLGGQELNFHQQHNGPLFGEKTLEVIQSLQLGR